MFSKTKKDGPDGNGRGRRRARKHRTARCAPGTWCAHGGCTGRSAARHGANPEHIRSSSRPLAALQHHAPRLWRPRAAAERRPGVADGMSGATVQNPAPRAAPCNKRRGVQNAMQETGKLIVGREIKMKGEITSCERSGG